MRQNHPPHSANRSLRKPWGTLMSAWNPVKWRKPGNDLSNLLWEIVSLRSTQSQTMPQARKNSFLQQLRDTWPHIQTSDAAGVTFFVVTETKGIPFSFYRLPQSLKISWKASSFPLSPHTLLETVLQWLIIDWLGLHNLDFLTIQIWPCATAAAEGPVMVHIAPFCSDVRNSLPSVLKVSLLCKISSLQHSHSDFRFLSPQNSN